MRVGTESALGARSKRPSGKHKALKAHSFGVRAKRLQMGKHMKQQHHMQEQRT